MRIRFSLGVKIAGGFGILLVLLLMVGGFGVVEVQTVTQQYNDLLSRNIPVQAYVRELRALNLEEVVALRGYILYGEEKDVELLGSLRAQSKELETKVSKLLTTQNSKDYLAQLEKANSQYYTVAQDVVALIKEGNKEEAYRRAEEGRAYMFEIKSVSDAWIRWVDQVNEGIAADVERITRRSRLIVVGLSVIALCIGVIIAVLLTKRITGPVLQVVQLADEVANGNLTQNIAINDTGDEISELSKAIQKMTENLRKIVTNIGNSAGRLSNSSEELTTSVKEISATMEQVTVSINQLADGITSQATESERSSSAATEMTANLQQMSANTEEISHSTQKVLKVATDGLDDASNAVAKIERIKGISVETSDVVKVLGEESEKIGAILRVIKAITKQTNLLALNAAIEAARAGTHGSGFAVVADEIRQLAENSAQSAGEIDHLISKIQKETQRAMEVMDLSVREVSEGVTIVTKAGDSFKTIVGEIERIAEQLQHLSIITQELASGSNEVANSAENVASISEKSAAFSQEISASTEEQAATMSEIERASRSLSELAAQMKQLVAQFKC